MAWSTTTCTIRKPTSRLYSGRIRSSLIPIGGILATLYGSQRSDRFCSIWFDLPGIIETYPYNRVRKANIMFVQLRDYVYVFTYDVTVSFINWLRICLRVISNWFASFHSWRVVAVNPLTSRHWNKDNFNVGSQWYHLCRNEHSLKCSLKLAIANTPRFVRLMTFWKCNGPWQRRSLIWYLGCGHKHIYASFYQIDMNRYLIVSDNK